MPILLLALILISPQLAHASNSDLYKTFPWLVKISSKYIDEGSSEKAEVLVQGQGFIIKKGDQYLVATASHVSQGNVEASLVIEYFDKSNDAFVQLKTGLRRSANLFDVEVISVTSDKELVYLAEAVQSRDHGTYEHLELNPALSFANEKIGGQYFFEHANFLPLSMTRFIPVSSIDKASELNDFLSLSFEQWEERLSSPDLSDYLKRRIFHGVVPGHIENSSISEIKNGMSGSPVIWIEPVSKRAFIEGIVSAKARHFHQSFFTSSNLISSLSGMPADFKYKDEVRWHLRDGLTFRRGAQGKTLFQEVNFDEVRKNTGGATRSDGGGATRSDGGGATRSDGGHSFDSTLLEGLQGGLSMNIAGKDESIIAILFQIEGRCYLTYADVNAMQLELFSRFEYKESYGIDIKTFFLPANGHIVGTFMADMLGKLGKEPVKDPSDDKTIFTLLVDQVLPATEMKTTKGKLILTDHSSTSELSQLEGIDVKIEFAGDELEFYITESGGIVKSKAEGDPGFNPVVQMSSKQGKAYELEASGLLFRDLSRFNLILDQPAFKNGLAQPLREFILREGKTQYRLSF